MSLLLVLPYLKQNHFCLQNCNKTTIKTNHETIKLFTDRKQKNTCPNSLMSSHKNVQFVLKAYTFK